MKAFKLSCFIATLGIAVSCGVSTSVDNSYVAEESGLNIQKITDASVNSVLGNVFTSSSYSFVSSALGGCTKKGLYWGTGRCLSISEDGTEIAYLSSLNGKKNVMVRPADAIGNSTRRTFRDVYDFSLGCDGNIYFSDQMGYNKRQIHSVNAKSGSVMRQITSNNNDINPVLAKNGRTLFFTRFDDSGVFIWMLDLENGALSLCSRGYNPCPVGDGSEEFLCTRNSEEGVSQIWLINYVAGTETLILSDPERGFSNPSISPDGQWIAVQGSSSTPQNYSRNLDLFAVKIDGSQFVQLTYHGAQDCNPVWSIDGKHIFFLSTRGTKDKAFNVWKLRFSI